MDFDPAELDQLEREGLGSDEEGEEGEGEEEEVRGKGEWGIGMLSITCSKKLRTENQELSVVSLFVHMLETGFLHIESESPNYTIIGTSLLLWNMVCAHTVYMVYVVNQLQTCPVYKPAAGLQTGQPICKLVGQL